MADASFILEATGVAATTVAAVSAAVSTIFARKSVSAALETAREARAARRDEILPRLIVEKDFFDFSFRWPHPFEPNGPAAFFARKHWQDVAPGKSTFSLSNFGQSPALDVSLVFELDDPNGEIAVGPEFEALGVSIARHPMPLQAVDVPRLQFTRSDGGGYGLPLYRRWTTDVPHCAPGQTRSIDLPDQLAARLFVRGIQHWHSLADPGGQQELTLTIKVSGFSVEGDEVRTQFRYRITPFCYGPSTPLEIYGHISELPMYAKPVEPRVA